MKHYIAIVLFLLSGCATTGTPPVLEIPVEARSYDDIWDASIAVSRNEGLTVVESNKNTGVIKAEHRYGTGSEKQIIGIFIQPPANSTFYTIEVKTLKGSRSLPITHNWDNLAEALKRALPPKPQTYGTVGLVSARFEPVIDFNDVTKGRVQGTLKGAKKGAEMGATPGAVFMVMGAYGGGTWVSGVLFLGGAGLAAVGGTVGAVVGSATGIFKADSEKTVQERKSQMKAVVTGLQLQEAMRERVEQYVNKQGGAILVRLSDAGPLSPDEQASYQSLAPQKIDTVLEITVTSLGMQAADKNNLDIDPALVVFIKARTRLVQTKNNTMLQDRPYIFESETRTFSEWSTDNGRLTAESMMQGYQKIAEQVFHSAF